MRKSNEQDMQRVFTRRALMLAGGKLTLFSALAARLYYLQVVESDRYALLSEENQFNLELLPPIRGRILDRFGIALADNQDNFRVEIVREQTDDVGTTLEKLASIIDVPDHDVRRVLKDVRRKRAFVPVTVVENLGRDEIAKVAVNSPYLPGIRIEVGRSRRYPFSDLAAHVTGYVAAVAENELTGDPVLELPDFRIGKNGIEKLYDRDMRGTAGQRQVEVNALGRIIRRLPGDDGQPGKDVRLTVDIDLQRFSTERLERGSADRVPMEEERAHQALLKAKPEVRERMQGRDSLLVDKDGDIVEPESGAAVLMDVHSGDVLVLASVPGYDPAPFNRGLSPREWEELISNPRGPLTNKAISGQYPPGSTVKMVTCIAALEAGVARPDTRFFCSGHIELGDAVFHCWRKQGHGSLDMIGAIENSCDCYLWELGKRLGIDRIAATARKLGLGQALGIDLPNERKGLVPDRAWKKAAKNVSWTMGDTLVASIGQGYMMATPLQLCTMACRIANGGIAVSPRLVRDPIGHAATLGPVGIDPADLDLMRRGMFAVINGDRGTARGLRGKANDPVLAGKSGTAQVKRITMAERLTGMIKPKDRPWKDRDHALFVSFGPYDAPRYAAAVVVEHGVGGSSMAGPIAADMIREALRRDAARTGPVSDAGTDRSERG